jgi:hypothetical protein
MINGEYFRDVRKMIEGGNYLWILQSLTYYYG